MKTTNFLRMVLMAGILASGMNVLAQGRGHDKGHHAGKHPGNHHHDTKRYVCDAHHCHHPVYAYHSAPVVERRVVYHYNQPRYVYYRDYDVYFDNQRNVFISFSGRNWTATTSIPVHMHRVDLRRANWSSVNYYQDDFTQRLEVRRAGGRMCSDW